jgi:hypothetical protein
VIRSGYSWLLRDGGNQPLFGVSIGMRPVPTQRRKSPPHVPDGTIRGKGTEVPERVTDGPNELMAGEER